MESELMASFNEAKEIYYDEESSSEESSSEDRWLEQTLHQDDSLPFEDVERSSTEKENSAVRENEMEEAEQLYTL